MKKIVLTVMLLLSMLAFTPSAHSEKCDPNNPDTCVGGPTGVPCGAHHQICCGVNGYDYDCISSSEVCNPNSAMCVATFVPCVVHCYNGWIWHDYYLNHSFSGAASPSQITVAAEAICLQLPTYGPFNYPASYVGYTCSY